MSKNLFVFFIFIILFGCLPVADEDDAQVRVWNINGKAKFSSTADSTVDVKLGLFYVNSTTVPSTLSTSYKSVSSVANVGHRSDTQVDFALKVDCRETTPTNAQLLCLFMWRDDNSDDTFSSTSEKSTLCQSKANSGSLSFTDGSDDAQCLYLYVGYNGEPSDDLGTAKGWNQTYGLKYKNIKKVATKRSGVYCVPDAVVECNL